MQQGNVKRIILSFLILSMCLAGIAQLLPWGGVDADTKFGGVPVSLKLDLYEHGVSYKASGRGEVGVLGVSKEVNITRSGNKTFLTGLGDFQEKIGFIFDSYKEDTFEISAWTANPSNKTMVRVKTEVEQIPWWVVGWEQKVSVSVKLNKTGENFSHICVNKVRIELWAKWNDTKKCYTERIGSWKITPNDRLYKVGDTKTYSQNVVLDKDYGRVGVAGTANITLYDKNNDTDTPLPPQISPMQMRINIQTMSQLQGVSILLMVAAFPLTLIATALSLIAIYFVWNRKRMASYLLISAGVLHLTAVLFYINGINTLIYLIGFVQEWFTWTLAITLPIISAALLFIGFAIFRRFKPEVKMKIVS